MSQWSFFNINHIISHLQKVFLNLNSIKYFIFSLALKPTNIL